MLEEQWKRIIETKLKNIKNLDKLEADDPNVNSILTELRELYARKMDSIDEHELLNIGGKLLGLYTSIGVTSSIVRAKRDAAEQAYDELLAAMIIDNKKGDTNITEARAIAKGEMQQFTQEVIKAEQVKNAYESITNATDKSISFIQSAIKVKQSERIGINKLADQYPISG